MSISETPLYKLVSWLLVWPQIGVSAMVLVLLVSAIGVVYAAHLTRQQYSEIQALERDRDHLDSEYEKLLLEQSAWADYSRVDRVSREELQMGAPAAEDIIVVTR